MRPTMRPAMNTARMAKMSRPMMPDADAAEDDLAELDVEHRHAAGQRRQAVVRVVHGAAWTCRWLIVDQRTESPMPKRTSLPSMLPPACVAVAAWSRRPREVRVAGCSLDEHDADAHAPRSAIAAARAPSPAAGCREPPERVGEATGMARSASISRKSVSGVGFSKGWAELALKKPPPLVPSSLMISCEATGPCAMVCATPSTVDSPGSGRSGSGRRPARRGSSAPTIEIGSRM